MKRVPFEFADGETRLLSTPSFYALGLMSRPEFECSIAGEVKLNQGTLCGLVAALLTDAEELDLAGNPRRTWTPAQAGKLIPPRKAGELLELISDLVIDSLGETEGGEADPPASGAGEKQPSPRRSRSPR